MRFLRTVWWSPFLTHGLAFTLGGVLLPLLFLLALNSRSLLLLSLGLTGTLAPVALARLHGICLWKPLAVQLGMALSLIYSWPRNPNGNWKVVYANHLSSWLVILFLLLACIQAASLLKRLRL